MSKQIEIIRMSVPSSWVLSDNRGQHYKTMMGKMSKIASLSRLVATNQTDFTMPNIEDVIATGINTPGGILELQHWKSSNRRFDLQNYGKTFKPVIDMCTEMGYWKDDDWRQFREVRYTGGGKDAWTRCKDLNIEYLKEKTKNNMSLLRIILHNDD